MNSFQRHHNPQHCTTDHRAPGTIYQCVVVVAKRWCPGKHTILLRIIIISITTTSLLLLLLLVLLLLLSSSSSIIISITFETMNSVKKEQHQQQRGERSTKVSSTTVTTNQTPNSLLLLPSAVVSSYFLRFRTLLVVFMAIIVAVMMRQLHDGRCDNRTVPLSNVPCILLDWNQENLLSIWNQMMYHFGHIDFIRHNQDWRIWSTAFYTASSDTYRATISSVILLVITMKYLFQMIQYLLLRIVFPHGTKIMNTYIVPQLYTQCHYFLTQFLLYHSQLTNEQLLYELLFITASIVFYFVCLPYWKRLRPILRTKCRSYVTSIQQVRSVYYCTYEKSWFFFIGFVTMTVLIMNVVLLFV